MQIYTEHCKTLRYSPSPITVLAQQDTNLRTDNGDHCFVVMVNKDDPLGPHPLLPASRPFAGELITWDLSWGDGKDAETDIPFFAQRTKAHPTVKNGLDVIMDKSPDDGEIYQVARVRFRKPPRDAPSQKLIASYVNVLGRTIRTEVYTFGRNQSVDALALSHEELRRLARHYEEKVHGLDLHRKNTLADMSVFET